jgi:hypothetical protein
MAVEKINLPNNFVVNTNIVSLNQDFIRRTLIQLANSGIENLNLLLSDLKFQGKIVDMAQLWSNIQSLDDMDRLNVLLNNSTPLIPSLYLLSKNEAEFKNHVLIQLPSGTPGITIDNLSKLIFISKFYLLTRAAYPIDGQIVPKILSDNMPIPANIMQELQDCLGAPLSKLDKTWVFDIDFSSLPENFNNRLGLGTAGYRTLIAYSSIEFRSNTPQEYIQLQEKVKQICRSMPDKNVHPLTRPSAIVSKYGSINKTLNSIMSRYATDESLQAKLDTRAIFERPSFTGIDQRFVECDITDFTSNPIIFKNN